MIGKNEINALVFLRRMNMIEKIIQFGEGGFLRGFADWMIKKANDTTDFDGKVVVVQPIENGMCDMLSQQNCVYTHICRGLEGVEVQKNDVISRCVKPYDNFDEYFHKRAKALLNLISEAMEKPIPNLNGEDVIQDFGAPLN